MEQEFLGRHHTVLFQNSFYWYNIPAILNQWIEVVFEHQFTFGSGGEKLKGKSFWQVLLWKEGKKTMAYWKSITLGYMSFARICCKPVISPK